VKPKQHSGLFLRGRSCLVGTSSRVARWFIFKPKIPIRVHFGGPLNGKCFIFYVHLEYFMAIWYNLWQSGIVCGHFPILACLDRGKSGNPDELMRAKNWLSHV
jgi:hypothetical protein